MLCDSEKAGAGRAVDCAAKACRDDIAQFLDDLTAGKSVSLLVAPAVRRHFSDYRRVFGFLRSLGVRNFYNVALWADITLWAYARIMDSSGGAFITSPCAAVTGHIMRSIPALRSCLMPVYSPLVCTAVYLQKYRKVGDELAFLSPCISKRAELRQSGRKVRYSVTIGSLKDYLAVREVDLSRYEPVDFSDSEKGPGVTLGAGGGMGESLEKYLQDRRFGKVSGSKQVYSYLQEYQAVLSAGGLLPDLLEVYHCAAGCDNGTGVGRPLPAAALDKSVHTGTQQEIAAVFQHFDHTLNLADFIWPEIRNSGERSGFHANCASD